MSSAKKGIFIAGTDTGVGKTVVAVAMIRALVQRGLRVAAMKPVAAGASLSPEGLRNADALALAAAANVSAPYEAINPYCFTLPVSPHIAASEAAIAIDTQLIKTRFDELAARAEIVIVEGAGGWLAPISAAKTMADIAVALDLPVLLVVGLRLGCLNHTLLTAQAIDASGLRLAAWVGNRIETLERESDNIATLEARLGCPSLGILPWVPLSPERVGLSASATTVLLSSCLD